MTRQERMVLLILGGVIFFGSVLNYLAKVWMPLDRYINFSPAAPHSAGIDLNSAGPEKLTDLPYIGEVMAQRIVDYRREHGPFREVEDLRNVPGIGPVTYERIVPFVSVLSQTTGETKP